MQFTEKDIESVPQPIVSLFNDLEQTIMLDIIRRLQANNKEITRSADWQINRLYELGKSKEEIKSYIKNTLNLSDEQIDKVFSNVISSGYARDKSLYDAVGKSFIPYEDNLQLQQLVNSMITQTKGELKNITGSLGFALREPNSTKLTYTPLTDYYQSTLDKAITQIATGAFDYNTVLRNTVKEMTNSGLRYIDYDSGYSSRVSVAVRRAVLTGYNQVVANINESNAEKLETNYFETTYHSGARPTHQPWQGRVYSKEELVSVCGLGTVTGLCGANCYHNYYPFIKGVSERTYTDEELDRMNQEDNEKREFRGKSYTKYEALQRQRKLETIMRAERQEIKLLTEGGADENDIMSANARYNKTSDEYARLSKAMNLPQQRQRVNIDGLGNIGAKLDKSSKVAKSNGTKTTDNGVHKLSDSGDNTNFEKTIQNSKSNIEKSNDSGMIKAKDSNNNETVVDGVHKIGKINIDIYKCVTEDITTDEVIITEKQIQHIKERHPNEYEMYFNYAKEIVENPDYVLQANKPYTAFILKHIVENGKNYQIILRLKTSDDPNEYKNSIITFLKVSDKRYNRYLRTKKILYKAE